MSRMNANMQKLFELREGYKAEIRSLQQQIEVLQNKLLGVEDSIKALGGDVESLDSTTGGARRRNVKRTVMAIINQRVKEGVTASEIVTFAADTGRELDRASVSSLLSRLKADQVLTFDGERYYPTPSSDVPTSPLRVIR